MARPLNLAAYGSPDIAELAAAYGVGLAKNYPFVEGNKRAAFLAVAAGELDEAAFTAWLSKHIRPR